MRWDFLGWSRGPLHEPYGTTACRNPPARMVRSAVLLFGDVCGVIVGGDALGFFLGRSRGPLHEPYGTTAYRNPLARMVRSAHPVGSHVPVERFPSGRPMIDIATEILQSLQARNGKRIGMQEISVIHHGCPGIFVPMPLGTRSSSMLPEPKSCSPLGMIHRQAERWRSLWFARC